MNNHSKQLDRQVRRLIDGAQQHQVSNEVMQIVTNILRAIAEQLDQPIYTILTAKNGAWLTVTLSNRNFPELEKQVVYAYPSYDVATIEARKLLELEPICQEMGVIDLLFQLLALKEIDSLIFFDQSRSGQQGKEISRQEIQNLCQRQLKPPPSYLA